MSPSPKQWRRKRVKKEKEKKEKSTVNYNIRIIIAHLQFSTKDTGVEWGIIRKPSGTEYWKEDVLDILVLPKSV
jgi:hypothetical protein